MQKRFFSLLSAVILAAMILSVPTVASAGPLKGGTLITPAPTIELKKEPDFVLATPEPVPEFKLVAPGITLATPTPAPEFKEIAPSFTLVTPTPAPDFKEIAPSITLATSTPTPDFKKIPATPVPTATPKILEGVTRVSPTPSAEAKKTSSVPEITKHPGAEIVDAGRDCSFVAYANNYDSISWYFKSGDTRINAADAAANFAGLSVTDVYSTKIRLRNVPASLNGWEIGAIFTNSVGSVDTNTCTITVKGGVVATPVPTAAPTPAATPVPTAVPTPEATAVPETPAAAEVGTDGATVSEPEPAATAAPTPVPTEAPKKESSGSILPIILSCVAGAAAACAAFFIFSRKGSKGTHYKSKH